MRVEHLFCEFGLDSDSNLFLIFTYEDGSLIFQIPVYNIFRRSQTIESNIKNLYDRLKDYELDIGLILLDKDLKDGFTEELFRWFMEGHLKKLTVKITPEDIQQILRN